MTVGSTDLATTGASLAQSVVCSVLWALALSGDLRRRHVPLSVLLALILLALIGQTWPWWVLTGTLVLWPGRRSISVLAPVAIGVGAVAGEPIQALVLAAGALAWGLNWWGGADSIALIALGLRHGVSGLIAGTAAVALMGIVIMTVRRRSLAGILSTLPDAINLQPRDTPEIPADAEMPAAAALAVAGLVLELARLPIW